MEQEMYIVVSILSGVITISLGVFTIINNKKKALQEAVKEQTKMETEIRTIQDRYINLLKDVEVLKSELSKLSSLQMDVALIKRDIDQLKDSYVSMTKQLQAIDGKINQLINKLIT